MTRAVRSLFPCLVFLGAGASPVWSQATATTGEIEVLVSDDSGAAMSGVTITVWNVRTA